MDSRNIRKVARQYAGTAIALLLSLLLAAGPAFSHGGKVHAGGDFTALQALQSATELYNQLVAAGKLDESWETDLVEVKVSMVQKDSRKEYRVSFHRISGEPKTVYIFFSSDGKYTGSNFIGK